MDPNIWGPPTWNIALDITWGVCKAGSARMSNTDRAAVRLFFKSLQYLLPCMYCRESYTKFLAEMGGAPPLDPDSPHGCTKAFDWVYNLKTRVNAKLNKTDTKYDKILRRMKTYRSAGNGNMLMDVLFIMAENFDADIDGPREDRQRKQVWFYILLKSLGHLAGAILPEANYGTFARAVRNKPIAIEHFVSKTALSKYLCSVYNDMNPTAKTSPEVCAFRYSNCRSEKHVNSPR